MKNWMFIIKKKIKLNILIAFFILIRFSHSDPSFDIEIDPADFILGGYRIHAGYRNLPMRYDVGVLSVEIPKLFHGNKNFRYKISGVTGRIDYLFGAYQKAFIGLEGTQMINRYTHKETNITETRYPFLFSTRTGYRFEFFEHLTITPWLGIGVLLNKDSDYVNIGDDKFSVPTVNIFPTVHLGWVF